MINDNKKNIDKEKINLNKVNNKKDKEDKSRLYNDLNYVAFKVSFDKLNSFYKVVKK